MSVGRVAIALLVWAGAIAAAAALSTAVANSTHSARTSTAAAGTGATSTGSTSAGTETTSTTAATPQPPFDPASVTPTDRRSMFRTANFALALTAIRRRFGSQVDIEQVRVAPGEVQLTIISSGLVRDLAVRANGQYLILSTHPLHGSAQAFTLAQVHPNVPAALARRIAAHGGVPTSQLEYMLIRIDPAAHTFSWLVYRNGGDVHFQADGASSPITEYGSRGVRTLRG